MRVYTCREFTGHYPVGAAAVVFAGDQGEAARKLNLALRAQGLDGDAKPEAMLEFPTYEGDEVRILVNGDY